jgi:hypothetical protein
MVTRRWIVERIWWIGLRVRGAARMLVEVGEK